MKIEGCLLSIAVVFALFIGLIIFLLSGEKYSLKLEGYNSPINPDSLVVVGENLIHNGDFEDHDSDMWRFAFQEKEGKILDRVGRNNSRGIMLVLKQDNGRDSFNQSIDLDDPPEVVVVTAWVKTEDLQCEVGAHVVVESSSQAQEHEVRYGSVGVVKSKKVSGNTPWTQLRFAALIHPDTDEIRVFGSVGGGRSRGKVFFDDIQAFPASRRSGPATNNNIQNP